MVRNNISVYINGNKVIGDIRKKILANPLVQESINRNKNVNSAFVNLADDKKIVSKSEFKSNKGLIEIVVETIKK